MARVDKSDETHPIVRRKSYVGRCRIDNFLVDIRVAGTRARRTTDPGATQRVAAKRPTRLSPPGETRGRASVGAEKLCRREARQFGGVVAKRREGTATAAARDGPPMGAFDDQRDVRPCIGSASADEAFAVVAGDLPLRVAQGDRSRRARAELLGVGPRSIADDRNAIGDTGAPVGAGPQRSPGAIAMAVWRQTLGFTDKAFAVVAAEHAADAIDAHDRPLKHAPRIGQERKIARDPLCGAAAAVTGEQKCCAQKAASAPKEFSMRSRPNFAETSSKIRSLRSS